MILISCSTSKLEKIDICGIEIHMHVIHSYIRFVLFCNIFVVILSGNSAYCHARASVKSA